MLRRLLVVLIIVCLISFPMSMLLPLSAEAQADSSGDYISLGDSIAYGFNAPSGQGYSDLFSAYLKGRPELAGLQFANLAHPGDESNDLLAKLQNSAAAQKDLSQARVVTISIGGNNLLGPVIRALAEVYHLDPSDPQLYSELGQALKADKALASTLFQLALSGNIETELDTGVATFRTDWPQILQSVQSLAPGSQIYVLNVYNPFAQDNPFFSLVDPYIQQINKIIETGQGYSYADIYTCFLQESAQKPLNYDLLQGNFDPHPTLQGHQLIFQRLSALFELANATSWGNKLKVPSDKKWIIKFNASLAQTAPDFVQVFTPGGISISTLVTPGDQPSSLAVTPPSGGYPPGSYSLLIRNGLPAQNGTRLDEGVRMNFTVE
ncbi:GDSL-type esterase/lipase family protein [Desulfosporosinus sp. PR]|uniref:GDSL-type esterase/lipase family protein n=1 Tax=Candidatus Desulfosporosinus nitrosoreducens TaxID=3401928 RepID=UPI0027F6F7AF|nr:GDSL-type esterase/lipase family protein [Desulfosporosinus sp. PR]MDQ7095056.1 GDSL-type esterase/lipase family protein [Desulfosporosinus sp. PR]